MASAGGTRSVIIRGFDFGTTHEQIATHMSAAGTVESVDPVLHASGTIDMGVVRITYTTAEEAKYAAQLQQTCIPGNSRYIDVITLDPVEFLSESPVEDAKAQQFYNLTPDQQYAVMARGTLTTARDPTAVLVQRMNQARQGGAQGFNAAAGGGGLNFGGDSTNLGGGCCVLVRGFDFNTSDQDIFSHMSRAGTVQNIQKVENGSVRVTFNSADEAKMASQLNQTIIAGNSRYIDVMLLDPKAFVADHGIDSHKAMQFMALLPDQQLAVMAKGSLSTARDPNAVLVSRMNQVKQGGKGSFGPAQGKGNTGSSPYGGGAGKGSGSDMQGMMMQMMQMMMKQMQSMNGSSGSGAGSSDGSMDAFGGMFGAQQS